MKFERTPTKRDHLVHLFELARNDAETLHEVCQPLFPKILIYSLVFYSLVHKAMKMIA